LSTTTGRKAVVVVAYLLGAVLLAGQAAVHVQQYASIFHRVHRVGGLFLADAALSVAAIAGLVFGRSRRLAALVGVVISVGALGSLVVSYGRGLFGWQEAGFRTPVELAVVTEVGAVICLSVALAARAATPRQSRTPHSAATGDPTDSTTADAGSRPANQAVLVDLRTGVRNMRGQHHPTPGAA
jgi:hypothetical protein